VNKFTGYKIGRAYGTWKSWMMKACCFNSQDKVSVVSTALGNAIGMTDIVAIDFNVWF